jgi:AcrR family transcriptional regulator
LSRIVRATVEVADTGGLDAVSMARIAERLGLTTMSLYKHVRSKNEMLLLMLDSAAAVPAALDEPCDDHLSCDHSRSHGGHLHGIAGIASAGSGTLGGRNR